MEVALKTLSTDALEEDEIKFLQEAAIMAQFKHPNIVHLHGIVTQGSPVSYQSCMHVRIIVWYKGAK